MHAITHCASCILTHMPYDLHLVDCLSGLVVELNYSDGTFEEMVFISNPTSYYTTEGQVVGFHGIAGENCIKRLGVYTQMDSELRGEHAMGIVATGWLICMYVNALLRRHCVLRTWWFD